MIFFSTCFLPWRVGGREPKWGGGTAPRDLFKLFQHRLYVPRLEEDSSEVICFGVNHLRAFEVNAVVTFSAVLSQSTALYVRFPNVVLVLSKAFWDVMGFTDVIGGALCTRNLVNDPLGFLFWRVLFWSWHQSSKC